MFQQGLGLFTSALQGGDLSAGLARGTQAGQGFQRNQMAQIEARRRAIAQKAQMGLQQQRFGLQEKRFGFDQKMQPLKLDLLRAQIAKANVAPNPYMNVGPGTSLIDKRTGQVAFQAPYKPKGMSATDKKAIYEAQDELPGLHSTVDALDRASQLNKKTYEGFAAGPRGAFMNSIPFGIGSTEEARATAEFGQIMDEQAILAMAKSLKGATSDNEMNRFIGIISDRTLPMKVRASAINRLRVLANRQMKVKRARLKELGGQIPDLRVGNQRTPPGGGNAPQADPLGIR